DPDGVVVTLANVDTDEHVDTVVLGDHEVLPGAVRPSGQAGLSCGLRARHPRYARPANTITRPAWSGPYQRSSGGLSRPGDNTPRIINDWAQRVIPGPTGQPPRPGRFGATKKVTGPQGADLREGGPATRSDHDRHPSHGCRTARTAEA